MGAGGPDAEQSAPQAGCRGTPQPASSQPFRFTKASRFPCAENTPFFLLGPYPVLHSLRCRPLLHAIRPASLQDCLLLPGPAAKCMVAARHGSHFLVALHTGAAGRRSWTWRRRRRRRWRRVWRRRCRSAFRRPWLLRRRWPASRSGLQRSAPSWRSGWGPLPCHAALPGG